MKEPLINILTRTSNRPNGFRNNRYSITKQTYKNIKHIVCYDDGKTKDYLLDYDDITMVSINRELLIAQDKSKIPGIQWRLPHNLYFNELHKEVEEGWVLFLDDDDSYRDETVIQTIVDNLPNEDDILIWQMIMPNGSFVPDSTTMNAKRIPIISNIGTPCFAVHSKHLHKVYWDGWRAADFRFFDRVCNVTNNVKFLTEGLVIINQVGLGNKKDIQIK
tara:strand:+ start:1990 stop:2646 length:657 start_codon:yes stop_codon:yes gene_type:complete